MDTKQKELHEKVDHAKEQMRSIVDHADAEGRDLTKEENDQFSKWDSELETSQKELENRKKLNSLEGQKANEGEEKDERTYKDAFKKMVRYGEHNLDEEDRKVLAQNRAQSVGTDSKGGYTVAEEWSDQIINALKKYSQVRDIATVDATTTGEDMHFATSNDTGNKGSMLSENTAASVTDISYNETIMKSYTFTSDQIEVSRQLLQDSHYDIEGHIERQASERLGRAINEKYTTGTGSSEPEGYISGASLGHTTSGTISFGRTDILELMHSVDPAYMDNGRFTFSNKTLLEIKKLALGSSDARPLWQPSMRDGAPPTLEGMEYFINQDMADSGTKDNKFMAFGDFSYFHIRDVLGMEMLRLDERAAEKFQVIFIMFMRTDSRLIDPGTSPINYMKHAAS